MFKIIKQPQASDLEKLGFNNKSELQLTDFRTEFTIVGKVDDIAIVSAELNAFTDCAYCKVKDVSLLSKETCGVFIPYWNMLLVHTDETMFAISMSFTNKFLKQNPYWLMTQSNFKVDIKGIVHPETKKLCWMKEIQPASDGPVLKRYLFSITKLHIKGKTAEDLSFNIQSIAIEAGIILVNISYDDSKQKPGAFYNLFVDTLTQSDFDAKPDGLTYKITEELIMKASMDKEYFKNFTRR